VEKAFLGRVLLVDDDEFLRVNLSLTLQQAGYTVFETGERSEALALLEQETVDVVVIDVSLQLQPNGYWLPRNWYGIELGRTIKMAQPLLGIVFISAQPDPGPIFWELPSKYTGIGYLLKPQPDLRGRLLDAVARVQTGDLIIERVQTNSLRPPLQSLGDTERHIIERILRNLPLLTTYELEIVQCFSQGMRPARIASELGVKSVDNILTNIYRKLDIAGEEFVRENGWQRSVLLTKAILLNKLAQAGAA
jgi:DNA-binding NarL/FixJ family response regulator